nr:adenine deaminase [uncultured Desulfobulbus sp.]
MERIREVSGHIVDLINRRIFGARLEISPQGIIEHIHSTDSPAPVYILPGFVDAHVHIESSMLCPSAFAQAAVCQGTLAAVTDPHEIANVLGLQGVEFMLSECSRSPFYFAVGAPSCVPATPFDSAGAALDAEMVAQLLQREDISHLSEMMNVPGVLLHDPQVWAKLAAAKRIGKPIDGHAPGLSGDDLRAYRAAGISTDHECLSPEEAVSKAAAGMKILLRQGSAARNFLELLPVMKKHPHQCMFCADDKHPDELMHGYINQLVQQAVAAGYDLFDVLISASLIPVRHYGLSLGMVQVGDSADWIEVDNLQDFTVRRAVIKAEVVAEQGVARLPLQAPLSSPNHFNLKPVGHEQFQISAREGLCRCIGIRDGELITDALFVEPKIEDHRVVADTARDLLKLAVFNRYAEHPQPALSLVQGLGIKEGALAASVAHDSHHLICAGTDDRLMATASNAVIEAGGGLAVVSGAGIVVLMPLPVAGLMTTVDCAQAAAQYRAVTEHALSCGCILQAPFMTLSFLALPVIPELKLTDKGLFDAISFSPVGLWKDSPQAQ